MYRPTVRYDDIFKNYVTEMFRASSLDRNQIIRAALFAAAHSVEFRRVLQPYLKKEMPAPKWSLSDDSFWLEQKGEKDYVIDDGRGTTKENDVSDGDGRRRGGRAGRLTNVRELGRITSPEGRPRTIPSEPIRLSGGGLVIKID